MRRITNAGLCSHFIGWQCRIRQMAARDYGGEPMPAMRPRVSNKKGEVLLSAMTVLLVPLKPAVSTAFFRFQVQRTDDSQQRREAGVAYLAGDFYQEPELFSDEMTAVFNAESETASRLVTEKIVLLDFEQYSQSFRMFSGVHKLAAQNPVRAASLWQSRLFNPNVPNDAAGARLQAGAEEWGCRPDAVNLAKS